MLCSSYRRAKQTPSALFREFFCRASSPRLQYLFGTRTGDQNCRKAVVGAQLLVAPFTLFTLYSTLFSSPSNL